jgi:hypothetical protein
MEQMPWLMLANFTCKLQAARDKRERLQKSAGKDLL